MTAHCAVSSFEAQLFSGAKVSETEPGPFCIRRPMYLGFYLVLEGGKRRIKRRKHKITSWWEIIVGRISAPRRRSDRSLAQRRCSSETTDYSGTQSESKAEPAPPSSSSGLLWGAIPSLLKEQPPQAQRDPSAHGLTLCTVGLGSRGLTPCSSCAFGALC